jgi:hypothetical protein
VFIQIPSAQDVHVARLPATDLASETTITVNTMHEARWHRTIDCETADLAGTPLNHGEVRVFLPSLTKTQPPVTSGNHQSCRPVGILMVCSNDE